MALTDSVSDVLDRHGLKFLRYCGVSVVSVSVGQTILQLCYTVIGFSAITSNVLAVVIGTIPGYLLNRSWVWRKTGPSHIWREIVPFWSMAFLGLLLSTLAVAFVSTRWPNPVAISLANIAAFGVVWVFRYLVLEHWMFVHREEPAYEPVAAS